MSWKDAVAKDPELQEFTATGRPIPHPKVSGKGSGLSALGGADSLGAGTPNLLPPKFTDDSIISVPVLPPDSNSQNSGVDTDNAENPVKEVKSKSRLGSIFRKSVSGESKGKSPGFVMKKMKRSEYLKRYAKDDEGIYIGTEDPAPDCILNSEHDKLKYRKPFA